MNDTANAAEKQRLSFIEARNGKQGAIDFAAKTMAIYRKAVLTSKSAGM